jgi:hypothetical protein
MDDQSLDRQSRFGRRFGVLLIVLLVAAGSAAVSYNLGLTRDLAQAGVAAGAVPSPSAYYGYYYGPRPWGFGPFGPLLVLALWFVVLRSLVWRGPWHRGWGGGGPRGGASRFDDWHRQAHERMKNDSPVDVPADANR